MKHCEWHLQPFKTEAVCVKPSRLSAIPGPLTVSEVKGYGRQKGIREIYRIRDTNTAVSFLPKLQIRIASRQDAGDKVGMQAIADGGQRRSADGQIFVYSHIDQPAAIAPAN